MKALEEAFSSGGFRRVILPGIVLTLGLHPLLNGLTKSVAPTYGITEPAVVLIAEVILLGLVLSSCINWIYYVYEGFKLPWLTALAGKWNKRHLAASVIEYEKVLNGRQFADLSADEKVQASLIHEKLADYPLELSPAGKPERSSERPTTLGNIIASYELYAKTRYQLDGVFYWYHLLAQAPDLAAKEFSEKYAFAESLVLTSFAGAVVAVVDVLVLVGFGIAKLFPSVTLVRIPIGVNSTIALALFGAVMFLLFYGLSLPAHREAGRVFRSIVDLSIKKVQDIVNSTAAPLDDAVKTQLAARKRYLNALK